jgi:hypothetical protein
MIIVVLSGVVCIVTGLICLINKDTAWSWTQWSNRTKGVKSERTPEWETFANIGGGFLIVAGVFLCFVATMLQADKKERNFSGTTVTFTDSAGKNVERRLTRDELEVFNKNPGKFLPK